MSRAQRRAPAPPRPPAPPALGALLAALLLLPCGAARADAPEQIDRAVQELAAFVRRSLPDREGDALVVLPFVDERGQRVLLGDRLAGELELALAADYRRTRLGGEGLRTFTLLGELQPYASRLRVLCRLLGPDGGQLGLARAELALSGELQDLLAAPAGPGFSGQGLHGPAGGLDPLEPDDSPGAEAPLAEGGQPLERWLDSGDIDRFRFHVSEGQPVRLEVRTEMDVQLVLYREGERVPFQVLGNPGRSVILFEAGLAPGYYVAELMAFSPQVQGPYSILLAAAFPAAGPFEPGDAPAEPRPLAVGAQERTLAAGSPDWVALTPPRPGFYCLYTTGQEVDTSLALLRAADGRVPVMADEDGGAQANAFLGFFLGPGRWLARVGGRPPRAAGRYGLRFEPLAPQLIVPGQPPLQVPPADRPSFFQLRVLSPGRVLVRAPGAGVQLYELPGLRALQAGGPLGLAAGDYLLRVDPGESREASLTVAEE